MKLVPFKDFLLLHCLYFVLTTVIYIISTFNLMKSNLTLFLLQLCHSCYIHKGSVVTTQDWLCFPLYLPPAIKYFSFRREKWHYFSRFNHQGEKNYLFSYMCQ